MENLELARKLKRKYKKILDEARWNTTLQRVPNAANIYIQKITEYTQALKDLGYRTTDETEKGKVGRLVLITQEWKDQQRAKMTEVDLLMEKARNAGPNENGAAFIREAVRRMAQED